MRIRNLFQILFFFFILSFSIFVLADETNNEQKKILQAQNEIKKESTVLESHIKTLDLNSEESIHFQEKLDLVNGISQVFGQKIEVLSSLDNEQTRLGELEKKISDPQLGLSDQAPFSYILLDNLERDHLLEETRQQDLKDEKKSFQGELEVLRGDLDEMEKERRLEKDASPSLKDSYRKKVSDRKIEIIEKKILLAQEEMSLCQLKLKLIDVQFKTSSKNLDLLSLQIKKIRPETKFSEDDLKLIYQKLDRDILDLEKESEKWQLEYDAVEKNLLKLSLQKNKDEAEQEALSELTARRLEKNILQKKLNLLSKDIKTINEKKKIWKWQFDAFNGNATKDDYVAWNAELSKLIDDAVEQHDSLFKQSYQLFRDISQMEERIEKLGGEKNIQTEWLVYQVKKLRGIMTFNNKTLLRIEGARRFYSQFLKQTETHVWHYSPEQFFDSIFEKFSSFLNTEITQVDDRPITIKKIFIALVILLVGLRLSRVLSRILRRKIIEHFVVEDSAQEALQTITLYILILFFSLFALQVANVPLTIFTLLGGALAIGLGFGSQNLINNFISGLIILAERPVRIGDQIEVDGQVGRVIRIGARSTHVRTYRNVDILVPNSVFLEKNVINWTLSDQNYRTKIVVGVDYGSPTRKVADLIQKAVHENPLVIDEPPPVVLFTEFGDSALIFEAHFWVSIDQQSDRRVVESNIRFRIDELFREEHIIIAYPQRDVHLNTSRPLEVKIFSNEKQFF